MVERWQPRAYGQVVRELHISKGARERYGVDELLFSLHGNIVVANLGAARELVQRINQERDVLRHPERGISAGALNAAGLIDELWHHLFAQYRQRHDGDVVGEALSWLELRFGEHRVEHALRRFLELFPSMPVVRGELTVAEYLEQETAGVSHRQIVLEELLMLWLANQNPAFDPLAELFDDAELEADVGYREIVGSLGEFFEGMPPAIETGPDAGAVSRSDRAPTLSLFDALLEPIQQAPESLTEQLRWLLDSGWLGSGWSERQSDRLLVAMDVIKEESKPSFRSAGAAPGPPPGPPPVNDYAGQDDDEEHFSQDRDWMPEVVLLAKNTYVWLHQLSVEYGTDIERLDQIPDAELDRLARRGFNSLWLIGIWERSPASQRVKQLCGNPEAASSAYSLRSYRVAETLGGDDAWDDLRRRAEALGIRLACDMVPNHTGIDSEWIVKHPERFLSLPYSPYPNYRFTGEDLCDDARVEVRLEDHYFDRTDAAVVFQRRDVSTDEVRYVYHGNDGTSIPWNDTAQLDYLDPDAREAVIQTILNVARRFSVIRFDAAMTLAKRHIQRLWYPKPGQGGAIPSRAEHAISEEAFQRCIPEEFWREVVDRVAAEVPDTLLLAEAFWLMEGYFVRTLGMHRVYNSAFMHMLRDEENAKFRQTLRNTLEFDPEVLKRFVNYLTTPDEEPAAVQVGTSEKYFCVCTLMATLPGLPMFGHGQFEGLREKYGMEYARAYHDEAVDTELIERHEHEIVPLLLLRRIFAEVTHFRLYNFQSTDGSVNEDVYALSNRYDEEAALVFVHNTPAFTEGYAHHSVAWRAKVDGGEGVLVHSTLGEALQLRPGAGSVEGPGRRFLLARDLIEGREYLRPSSEVVMRGFSLRLGPYERRVLVDLHEVTDDAAGRYQRLWQMIGIRGVPSLDDALAELRAAPVQEPLRRLLGAEPLRRLWLGPLEAPEKSEVEVLQAVRTELNQALAAVRRLLREADDATAQVVPEAAVDVQARDAQTRDAEALDAETPGEEATEVESMVEEILTLLRRLHTLPEHTVPGTPSPGTPSPGTPLPGIMADRDEPAATVPVLGAPASSAKISQGSATETPLDTLLRFAPAPAGRFSLAAWIVLHPLGRLLDPDDSGLTSRELFDTWLLDRVVRDTLLDLGVAPETAEIQAGAVSLLAGRPRWWRSFDAAIWLQDPDVRRFLGINRFDEVDWFGQEEFAELLWWLAATAAVQLAAVEDETERDDSELQHAAAIIEGLAAAEQLSGYRVLELADALQVLDGSL